MHSAKRNRSLLYVFVIAVGLCLLATACSDTGPASDEHSMPPDTLTVDDLARFVAAAEAALVGTGIKGDVLEAPEIYIAIAQASCARFTQGDSLKEIVNDLMGDTTAPTATDEQQLIGAVLGAAVETICPEHTAKL